MLKTLPPKACRPTGSSPEMSSLERQLPWGSPPRSPPAPKSQFCAYALCSVNSLSLGCVWGLKTNLQNKSQEWWISSFFYFFFPFSFFLSGPLGFPLPGAVVSTTLQCFWTTGFEDSKNKRQFFCSQINLFFLRMTLNHSWTSVHKEKQMLTSNMKAPLLWALGQESYKFNKTDLR